METIGACIVICNLKTFRWLGKKKKKQKQTNKQKNQKNFVIQLQMQGGKHQKQND